MYSTLVVIGKWSNLMNEYLKNLWKGQAKSKTKLYSVNLVAVTNFSREGVFRGYTVILFLSYHIFRVTMSHVDVLEDKL